MIEFVGHDFVDEAWIGKAAAIRPVKSCWSKLGGEELARLESACRPGFAALESAELLAAQEPGNSAPGLRYNRGGSP